MCDATEKTDPPKLIDFDLDEFSVVLSCSFNAGVYFDAIGFRRGKCVLVADKGSQSQHKVQRRC